MSNNRGHVQQSYYSNSSAIRQEIQRFESVHPSIYAIYDLLELIPDPLLAQQIREHVVCIEDSFVNSQEWTLSRTVPDLRLGIVGSLSSGKSALVHRYLTGSYMQDESPEGGRFKKEVVIDGQSYLLLIRDEGGSPELQFSCWVDAVILVFSLENEPSFNAVYNYYTKMAHFRNSSDVPLILVGTQDAISESNPRVIDDARARKLASDLKRCSYYETCATYGLNVERVFQDACQKIVQLKMSCLTPTNSRPGTPVNHMAPRGNYFAPNNNTSMAATNNGFSAGPPSVPPPPSTGVAPQPPAHHQTAIITGCSSLVAASPNHIGHAVQKDVVMIRERDTSKELATERSSQMETSTGAPLGHHTKEGKELPTPCSTPTTSRKTRRRSNLFPPLKKGEDDKKLRNGEVGSGRVIPIRQGYLYKRSCKALNKDWKKKYVTLTNDGRLTYHPSLHDYMDDVHGKEIPLMHTTVKIPGQKPRGSRPVGGTSASASSHHVNDLVSDMGSLSVAGGLGNQRLHHHHHFGSPPLLSFSKLSSSSSLALHQTASEREALLAYERGSISSSNSSSSHHANVISNIATTGALNGSDTPLIPSGSMPGGTSPLLSKLDTPNIKKRHRRMKSTGAKNLEAMEDSDGYEFIVVSLDNKQWHFEATNTEDREAWVTAIEQQILNSLQGNESCRTKSRTTSVVDSAAIQAIRSSIPGNMHCVDCDSPNPDWASLNLGALMCIECSGIHRNLGSHISRVRSLNLDEWSPEHISVMMGVGNAAANSIWEGNTRGRAKPTPNSSREEKERWIRTKYEFKEYLAPLSTGIPLGQQLIDAVCKSDPKQVALVLAHASSTEQVNTAVSGRDPRTPLHLAAAVANLAIAQLLIWNHANVKAVDNEGRTALAYAKNAGCQDVQDLLVHSGCSETSLPSTGTLSRRRGSVSKKTSDVFEKLPASII